MAYASGTPEASTNIVFDWIRAWEAQNSNLFTKMATRGTTYESEVVRRSWETEARGGRVKIEMWYRCPELIAHRGPPHGGGRLVIGRDTLTLQLRIIDGPNALFQWYSSTEGSPDLVPLDSAFIISRLDQLVKNAES